MGLVVMVFDEVIFRENNPFSQAGKEEKLIKNINNDFPEK